MARRVIAGFVPLVDCAVLVAARELGFAREQGIDLELLKEPSWASLRDHLNLGHVDGAHALAPLPIASTLGIGHVQVDCVVPFVLSRGGNAITVSTRVFAEMTEGAEALALQSPAAAAAALATVARRRAEPLTLGMVFPFSSHNFDLRYWLAAAGMHPDRDVRLVAIPPPLMVESLRAGHVDGFCVGEPWSSLAVAEGIGRVVATKAELFPGGPEKVLAVPARLGEQPSALGPLLRSLAAAAEWADDVANRGDLARLLARPEYLCTPAELIEAVLSGVPLGTEGSGRNADFIYFHRHGANVPRTDEALWIYAHMVRWGQLRPSAARERAAARVFRPDLYGAHLDAAPSLPLAPAFDGIEFTPEDVAGYAERFALRTAFVAGPGGRE